MPVAGPLTGRPALIVEVLSDDTWDAGLDLERGKPVGYRRGGVAEYLVLDPPGEFMGRGGRGHVPRWVPGCGGRWASRLTFSVGWEGVRAVVYDASRRLMPGVGQVLRAIAAGEACGRAEGLLVGRAMVLRLLELRFGPLPPGLATLAAPATLAALTEAALDAPSLAGVLDVLDRAAG